MAQSRTVLGLNVGPHDAAAAIVHGSELVCLVEEERLSRHKRALGESPSKAVHDCLQIAGISPSDIDAVAIGWASDEARQRYGDETQGDVPEWRDIIGVNAPSIPISYYPHHLAHCASGYWASGMERAAVLVLDGRGETHATSLWLAQLGSFVQVRADPIERSLGNFYGMAAEWAGFGYWGAGKLMGLAGYGRYSEPIFDPIKYPADSGCFALPYSDHLVADSPYLAQRDALVTRFIEHFPYQPGSGSEPMIYAEFAGSVQRFLEDSVSEFLIRFLSSHPASSPLDGVVLVGGVGMNCSLNGRLIQSGIPLYVPPFCYDAGVAVGAALLKEQELSGAVWHPTQLRNPYLASKPTRASTALSRLGGRTAPSTPAFIAALLARGLTVGLVQGRAEVGQRALGARSILAEASSRATVARLNEIKGREVWRPLAPVILEEDAPELLTRLPTVLDRFMLCAATVREAARSEIPAAVHVDGSCRPQVVFGDQPETKYLQSILRQYRNITGRRALLNTSFNLAGEPVVYSATDAIETFLRSQLDAIVVEEMAYLRDDLEGPMWYEISGVRSTGPAYVAG